jgi:enamine deaminase RidA (YjgF/YER057c/UK114 family)
MTTDGAFGSREGLGAHETNDKSDVQRLWGVYRILREMMKSEAPIVRDLASAMEAIGYDGLRQIDVESPPEPSDGEVPPSAGLSLEQAPEILQPKGWRQPRGYSHGMAAEGRLLFTAQVGWNKDCQFESPDLATQVGAALENIITVLAVGGAAASDVVKLTWFVRDIGAYKRSLADIGVAYRRVMGRHYPTMALFEVGLVDEGALVEIEATAVIAQQRQSGPPRPGGSGG